MQLTWKELYYRCPHWRNNIIIMYGAPVSFWLQLDVDSYMFRTQSEFSREPLNLTLIQIFQLLQLSRHCRSLHSPDKGFAQLFNELRTYSPSNDSKSVAIQTEQYWSGSTGNKTRSSFIDSNSIILQLMIRYGQCTNSERKIMDLFRLKFSLINIIFYICWLPNVLNGILIWSMWFDLPAKFVIATWYMEAILNPLQALFNCLVYRKWSSKNNFRCAFEKLFRRKKRVSKLTEG